MDSSGNEHRLKQFAPRYPTAAFLAGVRGSTIQKPGQSGETAEPIWNKIAHIMQVNLGMDKGRTNWPNETPGEQFDGAK